MLNIKLNTIYSVPFLVRNIKNMKRTVYEPTEFSVLQTDPDFGMWAGGDGMLRCRVPGPSDHDF